MPPTAIHFHSEGCTFNLSDPSRIRRWIHKILTQEKFSLASLNFVFCSDERLLKINKQYLDRENFTDVIAFDNADLGGTIEGDIFVSIDRVQDNADRFETAFNDELNRVMVHGLLHLLGYRDHTERLRATMRKKEDNCLELL